MYYTRWYLHCTGHFTLVFKSTLKSRNATEILLPKSKKGVKLKAKSCMFIHHNVEMYLKLDGSNASTDSTLYIFLHFATPVSYAGIFFIYTIVTHIK